jgi:hypothetical protein
MRRRGDKKGRRRRSVYSDPRAPGFVEVTRDPVSWHPRPGPCCENPVECEREECWTRLGELPPGARW